VVLAGKHTAGGVAPDEEFAPPSSTWRQSACVDKLVGFVTAHRRRCSASTTRRSSPKCQQRRSTCVDKLVGFCHSTPQRRVLAPTEERSVSTGSRRVVAPVCHSAHHGRCGASTTVRSSLKCQLCDDRLVLTSFVTQRTTQNSASTTRCLLPKVSTDGRRVVKLVGFCHSTPPGGVASTRCAPLKCQLCDDHCVDKSSDLSQHTAGNCGASTTRRCAHSPRGSVSS
jgi:hypothetical protein